MLISARRNRLIFEERLPIPVGRRQFVQKTEEDVENRWVIGIDNEDRSGFFIGRELDTIELNSLYSLSLQPQFLVQRAVVKEDTSTGDLFGLKAELNGELWDWDTSIDADISTFNLHNFANGSRYWGAWKKITSNRGSVDLLPPIRCISLPHLEWLSGRNRCPLRTRWIY